MIKTIVTRTVPILACAFLVVACPIDGRPRRSTCGIDLPGFGGYMWLSAGLDYYLTQPSTCPLELPRNGAQVHHYAEITGPPGNIQGDWFMASVWNAVGTPLGSELYPWYYASYSVLEADVDFYYSAGTGTPVAGYFTDRAEGRTETTLGGDAVATALLTYRKGVLTAMVGPSAPTPGTTVTWNVSAGNATGPYTYRWFKDGAELAGQTSSSLTLPVTTTYFSIGAITQSSADGADTLQIAIAPGWQVTISGMSQRSPNLSSSCGYTSDTGNNPSSSFTYEWYLDGSLLPDNGWTANPTFPLGSHTLELFVTDVNGYIARAYMTVDVSSDGPSNCM
jgi:hypothetical protein